MDRRKTARTVVFADDDRDDQRLLRSAFEIVASDIELGLVGDGQELLDQLRKADSEPQPRHPDLVLLDLNMPGMDGREALAEIKADKALRRIPVVVLTSSDSAIDISYAYEHGAAAYVCKPQNFDELLDFVRALRSFWFGHVSYATATRAVACRESDRRNRPGLGLPLQRSSTRNKTLDG